VAEPGGDALAAAWRDLVAALGRAESRVLARGAPDSPRDRAEGFRHLLRFLTAGHLLCVEYADPDHPEFVHMVEPAWKWGLDMPDCLYLYAPVRGDATYRIHGRRGSANHLDIQVNWGHFALGDLAAWGTVSSLSDLDLELDRDGRFELRLGGPPPACGGSWLPLAPNAEFVLVRQYFADWDLEVPAELAIERDCDMGPVPPPSPEQMRARLERLALWIERGGGLWERMSLGLVEGMAPNSLVVMRPPDEDPRGGLRGQAYGMGNFHCAPDQAVIVSFRPPRCRHWSVSLADWWWESLDFATRQSSLNAAQGRLDADGLFRGVIAHSDPGVPNWLDCAGHARGSLAVRFLLAEAAPEVEVRAVRLAELRRHLPPETPAVDADARAGALARRQRAVARRYGR
jgi:hypothetical protein